MKESKTIKILITVSLILFVFGFVMAFKGGWFGGLNWQKMAGGIFSLNLNNDEENITFWKAFSEIAGFKEEKNYLILFQNNLELRPSGGYLGNFGILKIKNGKVKNFGIHNTNIFDGFGKERTDPPMPIKKYLGVDNWQMRDSNWSPDFAIAAQKAESFYHLQGGQENFDAVIGINASVLPVLIKDYTGPIYLKEFNKNFNYENALYDLEYEVEKGYVQRGFSVGERKKMFKVLVKNVVGELAQGGFFEKAELKDILINELNKKNIQLFFKNQKIQKWVEKNNWGGRIKKTKPNKDYLMLVEANLGAKKSNYFIEREVEYFVDYSKKRPVVSLKIKYIHSNPNKDWFNDDYRAYLRVYTPKGSWLLESSGVNDETMFLDEFNKTVFGNWIKVPAGSRKIVEFNYLLPEKLSKQNKEDDLDYELIIQKQSGMDNELDINFFLKTKKGDFKEKEIKVKNIENFKINK